MGNTAVGRKGQGRDLGGVVIGLVCSFRDSFGSPLEVRFQKGVRQGVRRPARGPWGSPGKN